MKKLFLVGSLVSLAALPSVFADETGTAATQDVPSALMQVNPETVSGSGAPMLYKEVRATVVSAKEEAKKKVEEAKQKAALLRAEAKKNAEAKKAALLAEKKARLEAAKIKAAAAKLAKQQKLADNEAKALLARADILVASKKSDTKRIDALNRLQKEIENRVNAATNAKNQPRVDALKAVVDAVKAKIVALSVAPSTGTGTTSTGTQQ